ncbi:hypothetical protein RhiJN_08578 [Ceratobasidium sp. AG-Ba]|nr:hypothetical protein RhiJN_08578 [Ceratobasidium sp. AG-Ba]
MSGDDTTSAPEEKPQLSQRIRIAIADKILQEQTLCFSDANIQVKDRVFALHRYKLEEFRAIKTLTYDQNVPSLIEIQGDAEDFENTFKLLYTSSYTIDSLELEPPILFSTLRVATEFDHPSLRAFATVRLESLKLRAIEYIGIARELNMKRWEDMAIDKLIDQEESLTVDEARILGTNAFAHVTAQRELRLRKQALSIPSAEYYSNLPFHQQVNLRERVQAMLGLSELPASTTSSKAQVDHPSSATSPQDTLPKRKGRLPDSSPSKKPRIPGNTPGIVRIPGGGAGYRNHGTTVGELLGRRRSLRIRG